LPDGFGAGRVPRLIVVVGVKKFVRLSDDEIVDVETIQQISINKVSARRWEVLARVEGSDDLILFEGSYYKSWLAMNDLMRNLKIQEIDLEKIVPLLTPLIAMFAAKKDGDV
jgi:hypothetical protein